MCFNMSLFTNFNYLVNYNYFFFYNKLNLSIKNNFFLNFFRLNWFKNKIIICNTKIFFLKIKINKLFFFDVNRASPFNYFLKTKYINSNNFYNYNKNIINKNYFFILKLHFYFFKYFFLLISNIRHTLCFNNNYQYLIKTNKNLLSTISSNNLNLSLFKNLRKITSKNLLIFNRIL